MHKMLRVLFFFLAAGVHHVNWFQSPSWVSPGGAAQQGEQDGLWLPREQCRAGLWLQGRGAQGRGRAMCGVWGGQMERALFLHRVKFFDREPLPQGTQHRVAGPGRQ